MGKREINSALLSDPEEVLIGLIQEKDQLALSKLYDKRSGFVYSLAYSIVGNKSDAEEITEDVFYRLWDKADSFDNSRGSVQAWLTVITRRLAIDKTRSRQYRSSGREVSLEAASASGNPAKSQDGNESKIETDADAGKISGALGRLTGAHRDVIKLSYYEGLSHSKIADRLNLPLGTVKTRIREAVIQLRQILGVEV